MNQYEIKKNIKKTIDRLNDFSDDIYNANENISLMIDRIDVLTKELVSITSNELREYQRNLRAAYKQLKAGKDDSLSYPISPYETIVLKWDCEIRQALMIHYTNELGTRKIYMPVNAFEFMLEVLGV